MPLDENDLAVIELLVAGKVAAELREVNTRIAAVVATLRVEQSREVAALHDRIDGVHSRALRALTHRAEKGQPQ